MARKEFTLIYPDGSKDRIGCMERDSLLSRLQIRPSDRPLHYVFIGQVRTLHSLSELEQLKERFSGTTIVKKYLQGQFTVVNQDGSRYQERLETSEAQIARLQRTGQLQAA